jgi:hypothetical protein
VSVDPPVFIMSKPLTRSETLFFSPSSNQPHPAKKTKLAPSVSMASVASCPPDSNSVSDANDAIEVSDDEPEKPEIDPQVQLGTSAILRSLHSLMVRLQTNRSSPGAPWSIDSSNPMS